MLNAALFLSLLLPCLAALIIANRYRRRVQQLMSAPRTSNVSAPAAVAAADSPRPVPVSLADNRRAGIKLTVLVVVISVLIASTSTYIWVALSFPGEPLSVKRMVVMALLNLWPVIPVLALIWRWSFMRLFGTLLLMCCVCFATFLWSSVQPLQVLILMAFEVWLPLMLVLLVFWGNAARAVAPWLLIPAAVLMLAAMVGRRLFMFMEERESTWLMSIVDVLEPLTGGYTAYIAPISFILLAWIVALWPAWVLGRALGRAYSRKWLSDLLVVFTLVWAVALTDRTLAVASQAGAAAVTMYLSLLWIPMVMWFTHRRELPSGRPPTLLVLRVFQQDAQTQLLFDHVIERWRLSGNTVLIAGTDLVDRTLSADDIFLFLDRQLALRFVASSADVAARIAAFDMAADIDGRYRVNECYCHDTTWQDTLHALVHFTDVVLMDLRGFQADNAGCRYELATLARASRELRVVVLTDERTDRAAAQEEVALGRQERFTWIETLRFDVRKRREVLARLFA